MSFDRYFDLHDGQAYVDQVVNCAIGLAPKALHLSYMDLRSVDPKTGRGPSSIIATQMAASLVAAEAVRIILDRGPSLFAPHYLQIDSYRQSLRKGYLRNGNRSWSQQIKRKLLKKRLYSLGWDQAFQAPLLGPLLQEAKTNLA